MKKEERVKEISEAKNAGKEALADLYQASEKLSSAGNWGLWDMFGGGFVSTMVKHSKMDDASELMESAKKKLQRFQRELRDVQVPAEFSMEIGGFLTFADYFFDGFVSDWMVQSKIGKAKEEVEDAIRRVESILLQLERMEQVIDVESREV